MVKPDPRIFAHLLEHVREPAERCVESKSLKLYLAGYRNEGAFCEALAVKIRDDMASALELASLIDGLAH